MVLSRRPTTGKESWAVYTVDSAREGEVCRTDPREHLTVGIIAWFEGSSGKKLWENLGSDLSVYLNAVTEYLPRYWTLFCRCSGMVEVIWAGSITRSRTWKGYSLMNMHNTFMRIRVAVGGVTGPESHSALRWMRVTPVEKEGRLRLDVKCEWNGKKSDFQVLNFDSCLMPESELWGTQKRMNFCWDMNGVCELQLVNALFFF